MALCTVCGTVWNDEDFMNDKKHVCNPADVPAKGKQKRMSGVMEDLNAAD